MGKACPMKNNAVQIVTFSFPQNKVIIWVLDTRESSQYLQNASSTFKQTTYCHCANSLQQRSLSDLCNE